MLEGARAVLVGVSGGADSVALLDILSRLLSGSASPNIHVAHLDHMLRGRESEDDAKFVRSLAESMGIPVTVAAIDARAEAETLGRGIEEVAREIRYRFLLATALECGADRIATGHTMNDQAETFLMRLVRGAGLRGLAAMRPVTIAHDFEKDESGIINNETAHQYLHPSSLILHPLLIRPLLSITREEVEEYCRSRGLAFRTDATNLTTDYTRNRVRYEVLPALRAINPRAVEQISRTAQIIADDEDVLDHLAGESLDEARLADSLILFERCLRLPQDSGGE